MYLELGGDLLVQSRSVIGIFDLDNTSWSKRTRQFLEAAQENGFENVVEVGAQTDALLETVSGSSDACIIDLTMANAMLGNK